MARHRMEGDGEMAARDTGLLGFRDAWRDFKRKNGLIDYTDMIEYGGAAGHRPGVIIADEAQDLSRLELDYLQRLRVSHGAALILVGDGDQALYTWRGADWRVLFDDDVPADHIDLLDVSYRVPDTIRAYARGIITRAEGHGTVDYGSHRPGGEVVRVDATRRDIDAVLDIAESARDSGRSILLLTAANYMADQVVHALRGRALPYGNPGRKKRGIWNPLAARRGFTKLQALLLATREHDLDRDEGWTVAELGKVVRYLSSAEAGLPRGAKSRLVALASDEQEAYRTPGRAEMVGLVGDRFVDAWTTAADGPAFARWWFDRLLSSAQSPARYPLDVYLARGRGALEEPITRDSPSIFVGTVHSVKGAEADDVVVFPDIPWAASVARSESAEGENSLTRMFYVAATRARRSLYVCDPAGARGEGYFEL